MPKVYLAGPMRGYPQFNFPAFDKAAQLGRSLGWTVISPAEMDRENGIDEDILPALPRNGGTPEFIRQFINRDVQAIVNLLKAENGDAIAVLPKWEGSVGATGEVALGLWAKLRFLDAETFYPVEIQPAFRTFRPPVGESCEDGMCGMPSRRSMLFETADRIANSEHYGSDDQKL